MKVIFTEGKRSKHNFMPFGDVYDPNDLNFSEIRELKPDLRPFSKRFRFFFHYSSTIRFYKHDNTIKSCCRRIKKMNYPKGTMVFIPNWYVGYSDVYVIV